jgi:hypothetical protein
MQRDILANEDASPLGAKSSKSILGWLPNPSGFPLFSKELVATAYGVLDTALSTTDGLRQLQPLCILC